MIGARAGTNGESIETVLRGEGVARLRAARAGADDSPIGGAGRKQVVDHHRLVRPVERADPEVNDAGCDAGAILGRAPDLAGKPIQVGRREAETVDFRTG